MFSRRIRVKPPLQSATYRPAPWRTALLFAVCLAGEAHATGQPRVIQTVTVSGTARPLQLETKAGELLERSRVARDVKRLWATGWFDDIRVERESVPEGCVVRFQLTERTRYLLRRVRFKPRNFELPNPVPLGTLIDRVVVERLAKTFEEKLKDSGYREATVHFELTPVGVRQADVLFHVNQGRRYVVDTVEVSSLSHEDSRQVARILRGVQARRLLPGIPRVWKGWKLRPALNQETLNLALQSLRSHYISQGYLNATATVEGIRFDKNLASISVRVLPGTAYRLERLQISNGPTPARLEIPQSQPPLKDLCRCLLEKRAQAERSGISDFEAHLHVYPAFQNGQPWTQQTVSVSAQTQAGSPYRVRSIEFRGNHQFSDLTLRKMLLLSEGEWFDRSLLRRSLSRLNLTGLIYPLSEFDVEVQPDSAQHTVDVVIAVRERDRGRWFLGAPAWRGFSHGAWFSIGSRLPGWGPSYLELPTHLVAFNLTSPLFGLSLSALSQANLSFTLARPYFPGQSWRSGFQVSPQASWTQMLLASGMHQVKPRLAEWLQPTPSLSVPVQWNTASSDQPRALTSGVLICEPESKLQGRLLSYLQIATEWLLPATF
jgi:outer membrane protein assembly factor BamA